MHALIIVARHLMCARAIPNMKPAPFCQRKLLLLLLLLLLLRGVNTTDVRIQTFLILHKTHRRTIHRKRRGTEERS